MNQGAVLAIHRLERDRSRRAEPASYAKALRSLPKNLNGEAEAALGRWPNSPLTKWLFSVGDGPSPF